MAIPPYTNPPKHDVVMGQTGAYRGDAFHCLILAIFAEIYQTSEIRIKRGTHSWQTVFLVCAAKLRLYFGTRVFHFVPILKNVKLFRLFVEKEVKKDGSALSKLKKTKDFPNIKFILRQVCRLTNYSARKKRRVLSLSIYFEALVNLIANE